MALANNYSPRINVHCFIWMWVKQDTHWRNSKYWSLELWTCPRHALLWFQGRTTCFPALYAAFDSLNCLILEITLVHPKYHFVCSSPSPVFLISCSLHLLEAPPTFQEVLWWEYMPIISHYSNTAL